MRLLSLIFTCENARAKAATEQEQYLKVVEEFAEFASEVAHGNADSAREEAVDLMRALDGWISKQPDKEMRETVLKVQLKENVRGDSGQ